MRRLLLTALTFSTLLVARNDVPSCYDALKIDRPHGISDRELFILVDQTTVLDKNMMKYTYTNMMNFMKNGYGVTIASFSSNSNGKYTDVAYSGKIEKQLPKKEKYEISKKILRKYEQCMTGQSSYAKKKAKKALATVLKGANQNLPHSDILKSLADISKNIIQESNSKEKIILLVSDMLEHSSITSFYTHGKIKKININQEIEKINKSQYIADFGNAKIYVIGTGVLTKGGYRDAKSLKGLTDFWRYYFKEVHANLQEIGTPMLLKDVK